MSVYVGVYYTCMAKREVATVTIRVYPSSRKVLNRLSKLRNMKVAELVAILIKNNK